jgi:hypothetical protein
MKTTLLAFLAVLLGIALGVVIALLRIKTAPWTPEVNRGRSESAAPTVRPDEPAPKAVVDKDRYDFGTLDIASKGTHDFAFTNAGKAPLKLALGATSCRCAVGELAQEEIPPGGSTKVTVTWKPLERPGPYEQTAKILTNDPGRREVTLTVAGRFTAALQILPAELVFSQASAIEASTAQARLLNYLEKPIKISGYEWSNSATARYFEVAMKPLGAKELKEEPTARSGTLITVTVKPGLPQGPFRQQIAFHTDAVSSPTLTLPLQGTVGGEIAVVGRGWDPDSGILNLGTISGREGAQRRLLLVVRGPARKTITFKPLTVVPDVLKLSFGQRTEINHGAVVQTPLVIDIPPGSPTVNRLGSAQGKLGEIILETTHPQVSKVRILVRLAIER